jgi:3-deoxy-manno-octulosonate cytidylyltransferase (CMP-KDO synthetase)
VKVIGIIPARFGSTRFPGKPLADILGKPMILHVLENAMSCPDLDKVVVATDHEEIKKAVEDAGGEVVLTMSEHESGSDRCLEAYNKQGEEFDAVINIQGDEPRLESAMISELVSIMAKPGVRLGTLVKRIEEVGDILDPNRIKVVLNSDNKALYFSRSPIPFYKGLMAKEWLIQHNYYKHIGMYGYEPSVLREITHMEVSSLEKAESLEQLRWLENGLSIHCGITRHESPAIDTPEDLQNLLASLA